MDLNSQIRERVLRDGHFVSALRSARGGEVAPLSIVDTATQCLPTKPTTMLQGIQTILDFLFCIAISYALHADIYMVRTGCY